MTTENKLRQIVVDFYNLVFPDAMIGYMFEGKNKERLIEKELELAKETLGFDSLYTGRDLKTLHRPLVIQGGQFDRRRVLLKKAMEKNNLPQDLQEKWLAHTESLRVDVTINPQGECTTVPKKI
ncbi:MAG: group 1 truncated hemoglobin [Pseudomonadota bacterium]|nr:group 1 truncated hemoglobin [Pseudomonadota bacterium]